MEFNVMGDTHVTKDIQLGLKILGATITRFAEESSPTDETPYVLTGSEKLSILGQTARDVVNSLGN